MGSSDFEFYNLFKADPRWLSVFVEMNADRTYTFKSVTFKKLSRTCDGLLESDDPQEPAVIFEFQMQKKADIYGRIMSEIVMYRNEHPDRSVYGVIVFLNRETDPGDAFWNPIVATCPDLLKVLYLNEVYEILRRTQPNDPLQAIFAPFVETNRTIIRQNARKWCHQLNQLPYHEAHRETFFQIFMSWLTNSLPDLTEMELDNMTSLMFDISHTQFYRDVEEKTIRKHGHQIEASIRLKQLHEQLDEGVITKSYFDKKVKELKDRGLLEPIAWKA